MNTYTTQQVIKYTLAFGCSVSVRDVEGECYMLCKSHDYQGALEAVESVGIAEILAWGKDGQLCGWAQIVKGSEGGCEVVEYSGKLMERIHSYPASTLRSLFGA